MRSKTKKILTILVISIAFFAAVGYKVRECHSTKFPQFVYPNRYQLINEVISELGEPDKEYSTQLSEVRKFYPLASNDFESLVGRFDTNKNVRLLIWEHRCFLKTREVFVAIADPSTAAVLDITGSKDLP